MKQAIVIGCHVNGLGVIRSLHWKKFRIIAMFYNPRTDFAQASKYVDQRVAVPHPRKDEKQFINFLIDNSTKWKDALIIDTNDDVSIALSKNKEKLERHYKIPTPEWSILRKLIEKPQTYKLAQECEVPYPKTFLPKTLRDLNDVKNDIVYPCILKPVLGHIFFSEFKVKNFPAKDFSELTSKFEYCMTRGHDVMVQEIIPGPDSNIFQCAMYINSEGEVAARFATKKLRQTPPRFGVARVAISEAIIPEIVEFTERMLKAINFRGLMHSEFKRDPRDNRFKLMEINGRLARSNWLATYCGVNLPSIAWMDLGEQTQIAVNGYKTNVYWIEVSKDISNSIFLHQEEALGFKDYVEPYFAKNKTFADLSRNDFRPIMRRILNLLKRGPK